MKMHKWLLLILLFFVHFAYANTKPTNEINKLFAEMAKEIQQTKNTFEQKRYILYTQIDQAVKDLSVAKTLEEKVDLLVKKDILQGKVVSLAKSERVNIQKIRYLKGLSIIKLLYEKVLGLDHHFSSLVTFNEINKISNPNNYPEFERVKDLIKQKTDKKKRLKLTNLLN